MRKKYNVQEFKEGQLSEALMKLFAEVDPESLKKISNVLKRELKAEKDNEDYNLAIVSQFIDKAALPLMKVGQKSMINGDSLRVDEDVLNKLIKEDQEDFFSDISELKDYTKAPFSWKIAQDLRNHFVLKTNKEDTFDTLMDEVDGNISQYMSMDDWIKLRSVIKKAEARLEKSTYQMLEPEIFYGEERKLTNTELIKYDLVSLDRNVNVDIRKDGHDLLALKEFVSMLKGETVHPLSIGPGFFAKYTHELREAGISGIVFHIKNNLLKQIKLVSLGVKEIRYSPLSSAQSLIEAYCWEERKSLLGMGKMKKYYSDKDVWKDSKYFVVVDGCVSAPSNLTLGYEEKSVNDTKIQAGEVFLFEKVDKEVLNTRLYFTPYDYSKLHLFHQHGSVIFGNNDQSLHSCLLNESDYFDSKYRDYLLTRVFEGDKSEDDYLLFKPSFVACLINVLDEHKDVKVILRRDNFKHFLASMGCLYENNDLSIDYLIELHEFEMVPEQVELLKEFSKKYSPLNQRFLLGEYLEQKSGLTKEELETTYRKLAKIMKQEWLLNYYNSYLQATKKK